MSSDLPEVSQRVKHSTGFELRFHLVCKVLLSCLDTSHPSTLLLPASFTANKPTKPSSQPGYKQVFLPFIQHTLNLVESVKLQSVLKLCFECTREQWGNSTLTKALFVSHSPHPAFLQRHTNGEESFCSA